MKFSGADNGQLHTSLHVVLYIPSRYKPDDVCKLKEVKIRSNAAG